MLPCKDSIMTLQSTLPLLLILYFTSISTTAALASSTYDLLIVGGGSTGLAAARLASAFGKTVAIIEKRPRLGGDTTWNGVAPSKALLSCAKVAHKARTAHQFGVEIDDNDIRVNFRRVRAHLLEVERRMYEAENSRKSLQEQHIDSIIGEASFISTNEIDIVNENGDVVSKLKAKKGVILATGARPRRLDGKVEGLEAVNYLTYEDVFRLNEVPKRLTVVGGGAIGCELSQAFARLGSRVTIISERLLPNNDEECGELLEKVFGHENIRVVKGKLSSVRVPSDKLGHAAECTMGDGSIETVLGNELIIAVGRQPNTQISGLEEIGVKIGVRGGFKVDGRLETTVKGIYAAGDCLAYKQFAHFGSFQGAIAARNILLPSANSGDTLVPSCTFTSPEVASIGMAEDEAIATYGADKVGVAIQQAREIDRCIFENECHGFVKIVYRKGGRGKKRNQILGATIMLENAGEIINEVALAIKSGLPYDRLAKIMHAYPTRSFGLQQMAGSVYYDRLSRLKAPFSILKNLGY